MIAGLTWGRAPIITITMLVFYASMSLALLIKGDKI